MTPNHMHSSISALFALKYECYKIKVALLKFRRTNIFADGMLFTDSFFPSWLSNPQSAGSSNLLPDNSGISTELVKGETVSNRHKRV